MLPDRSRQNWRSITKSRTRLGSALNRGLRRCGGSPVNGRSNYIAAAGGASTSGTSTSGTSRGARSGGCTAGPRSTAATGARWLAATNSLLTAAATRFGVATNTKHRRDRSRSCPTKHTIHPDLPQRQTYSNMAADPRRAYPPATALSLVVLREDYFGILGELLQVSR